MKSITAAFLTLGLLLGSVHADISLPKKDTFYDKAGRGLANIVLAPAHLIDSPYSLLETEGPAVAASKGFVQGFCRMGQDMALGIFDVITAPIPLNNDASYATFKCAPYDSMVVNEYPPADLPNFY